MENRAGQIGNEFTGKRAMEQKSCTLTVALDTTEVGRSYFL